MENVWRVVAAWVLVMVSCCTAEFQYKRICYYTNWAQYRPGFGKFTPEDIDPFLCSHIIYAYAILDGFVLAPSELNDDSTAEIKGKYEQVNELKTANPYLKTLLAVGGADAGTVQMSSMLQNKISREKFIRTTIDFLRVRNFDGIDLHFEYPGARGSLLVDRSRFAHLIKELFHAFKKESTRTGKERMLITVSVAVEKKIINRAYDVDRVVKYADWINLMAYNFHGAWEKKTGFNAPLAARRSEVQPDKQFNVAWAVRYWLKIGCPPRKLVVGMAGFGRSFKLRTPLAHNVGADVIGGASAAPYTREAGLISYYEVCQGFIYGGGHMVTHKEHRVPYVYKGYEWIGYDDPFSLHVKTQWMKRRHLGGWMLWALDYDDFSGNFCGNGKYPLLKAMNMALGGNVFSPVNYNQASSRIPMNGTNALGSIGEQVPYKGGESTDEINAGQLSTKGNKRKPNIQKLKGTKSLTPREGSKLRKIAKQLGI